MSYINPGPWTSEGDADPSFHGPPPRFMVYDATGHTVVGAFHFEGSAKLAAQAPDLEQQLKESRSHVKMLEAEVDRLIKRVQVLRKDQVDKAAEIKKLKPTPDGKDWEGSDRQAGYSAFMDGQAFPKWDGR